jgi:hypothetical protein
LLLDDLSHFKINKVLFLKKKKRKIIFRNSKIYDFSKIEYFGDSFPNLFYNFIGKFGSDLTNKVFWVKKLITFFSNFFELFNLFCTKSQFSLYNFNNIAKSKSSVFLDYQKSYLSYSEYLLL